MSFTTYDQVGKAEDVSSIITNIDPYETPFQKLIGTESVDARNPEWQEDSLNAPSGMIAPAIEGADYSLSSRAATTMRSNYTEIRRLAFGVSETSDAVRTHGRAKETAYQLAKTGKELKKAWEIRLLSHSAAATDAVAGVNAAVGNASDTARASGNVWGLDASSSPAAILTNRSAATTAQVVFDEDAFLAGALVAFNNGVQGKVLMVHPNVALMIKDWATLPAGRFRDNSQSKTVTMMVDLLVTPYGNIKVVLNRWLGYGTDGVALTGDNLHDALLFDPSYWAIGTLRPWAKVKLAKVADDDRYALRGEFTLKHKAYAEGYGWVNLDAPVAA